MKTTTRVSLIVIAFLAVAPKSFAGCATTPSFSMMGSMFTVLKFISNQVCTRTMIMAANCTPIGPTATTGLLGSANTASTMTMSVSCGWNCACGQVTITGVADGLPVELLEYEISVDPEERSDTSK